MYDRTGNRGFRPPSTRHAPECLKCGGVAAQQRLQVLMQFTSDLCQILRVLPATLQKQAPCCCSPLRDEQPLGRVRR
jgi:hypothetical protein